MIENNVCDAFFFSVARDGNNRHGHGVRHVVVDRDNSFCAALEQQARVALEEFAIVVMNSSQKEIRFLTDTAFDTRDNTCSVWLANGFGDYTNGVGAAFPQRASKKVRPVIELARRGKYPLSRLQGNVFRRRSVIEN
jgi:hypothetical protein